VHHHIKNNMTMMMSLFSLQADAQKDPAASAALLDARTRMQSMHVLYDKLYR
jgi:two-component sensor histidine kinase